MDRWSGVLVEHGTMPAGWRRRPSRLYVSPELLGLTGADPLRDQRTVWNVGQPISVRHREVSVVSCGPTW